MSIAECPENSVVVQTFNWFSSNECEYKSNIFVSPSTVSSNLLVPSPVNEIACFKYLACERDSNCSYLLSKSVLCVNQGFAIYTYRLRLMGGKSFAQRIPWTRNTASSGSSSSSPHTASFQL